RSARGCGARLDILGAARGSTGLRAGSLGAVSTPPETPLCPRCGAPHGPDQEYCLECGYRLRGAAGAFGRLSSAWQQRFGWYPGDWIWPVALGFLIAVAGATAAIVLANAGAENK